MAADTPPAEAPEFLPAHFINRELSWLEFNQRVLEEALDSTTPLLERLKFFCIVSSNLDEFFEVRVAGLKQAIESEVPERSVDGLTASETFLAVTKRVRRMVEDQYRCWREQLRPAAASRHGLCATPPSARRASLIAFPSSSSAAAIDTSANA